MTTPRFLFILLVVLNALAFAAIKGWLGSAAPPGEPERISNQLHPEQIRLIVAGSDDPPSSPEPATETAAEAVAASPSEPAVAATEQAMAPSEDVPASSGTAAGRDMPAAAAPEPSAPLAAAASCVAWAELSPADADRLAARLNADGIKYVRSRKETPSSWWLRTPSQGGRAQAENRVRELREMGITDTFIVQESGPTQFAISLGLFRTESAARQLLAQLHGKGARDASVEPRMTTTYRIQASLPRDRIAAVEGRRSQLGDRRTLCTP